MRTLTMRNYLDFRARIIFPFLASRSPLRQNFPSRNLSTIANSIQKDPAELDEISTLPNGVRVASEALPGHFSGIGVFIEAGSRYENNDLRGVSHIIDRLAFKSTKKRSSDKMIEALELLGGNINCASSRESLMYQSATFNSAVPTTVALLAETIRDPLITEDEVQEQLETAAYEISEIWSKPELILPELVHTAAFKDNTLGNPLLCPKERLSSINRGVIEAYRKTFIRPERIVLAFAGVQHENAVKLAHKYFSDMPSAENIQSTVKLKNSDSLSHSLLPSSYNSLPPLPLQRPSKTRSRIPFLNSLSTWTTDTDSPQLGLDSLSPVLQSSHYTGGFLSLPNLPPPVNSSHPVLSHILLAFESLPISSEDIYALATLQTILGGGGSFSAGGPGKGMYSRLYTNVLNQHSWVESCVAFNHSYSDSGLFGISSSCSPAYIPQMLDVMCRELRDLTCDSGPTSLRDCEIKRAKNQLRSSLLMNLESRMVELEDLGRQVQVYGKKIGAKEMCQKIDQLTLKDLRRVAKTVVGGLVSNPGHGSGAPTVVLQQGANQGFLRKEFTWDSIQKCISNWTLGRN